LSYDGRDQKEEEKRGEEGSEEGEEEKEGLVGKDGGKKEEEEASQNKIQPFQAKKREGGGRGSSVEFFASGTRAAYNETVSTPSMQASVLQCVAVCVAVFVAACVAAHMRSQSLRFKCV